MRRAAVGAVSALLTVVGLSMSVAAHSGHGHRESAVPALAGTLVVSGVVVLGGSIYADHRHLIGRRTADVGVVVGVIVAATGIAWVWI
jgi:hypothetical protein